MPPPALPAWWRPWRCRPTGGRRRASRRVPGVRGSAMRTPSAAGNLEPGDARPRVGLPGETEHPLAEDVLVDLGRTPFDGVRPAAEHPSHLAGERGPVVARQRREGLTVQAEQLAGQELDALVELTLMDLADGALGARRTAGPPVGAHPLVGPVADPLLAVEVGDPLTDDGIGCATRPCPELHHVVDAEAADAIDAAGARPRDHLPLTRQRGAGDPPTFARPADAVVVGHASPVEEDLVEVDLAAEMAEGPDGHARLVHVEQEVRDALALRGERVGACEEHGPVGAVRPRGPDLLARDRPLVAIGLRPGGERRQVRPRARLAEQLAPALLVAHDRGQEPSSLRLRAVGEQRRRGQVETERVEAPEVVGRQHAPDDPGDSRADPEAAVPGVPGWDDQARTSEHGVPGLVLRTRTGGANSGRTAAVTGVAPGVGHVLRDPGPHPLGGGIGTGVGTDRDAAHQVAPGTGHRLIVP